MTQSKLRLPFATRARSRRKTARRDDPTLVFKNFVRVLEELHALPRDRETTSLTTQPERV